MYKLLAFFSLLFVMATAAPASAPAPVVPGTSVKPRRPASLKISIPSKRQSNPQDSYGNLATLEQGFVNSDCSDDAPYDVANIQDCQSPCQGVRCCGC